MRVAVRNKSEHVGKVLVGEEEKASRSHDRREEASNFRQKVRDILLLVHGLGQLVALREVHLDVGLYVFISDLAVREGRLGLVSQDCLVARWEEKVVVYDASLLRGNQGVLDNFRAIEEAPGEVRVLITALRSVRDIGARVEVLSDHLCLVVEFAFIDLLDRLTDITFTSLVGVISAGRRVSLARDVTVEDLRRQETVLVQGNLRSVRANPLEDVESKVKELFIRL